ETPASIRRLLRRCLEKDPKKRLSAIGDARLEIDEASVPDADATRGLKTRESSRTRERIWIGATAILALALAVVAYSWFPRAAPQPLPVSFSVPAPTGLQLPSSAPGLL